MNRRLMETDGDTFPGPEETGTKVAETTSEGYEVIDKERIHICSSRIHISPLVSLTLNVPIVIDVVLGRESRGLLEDIYHVITYPHLRIERGRPDQESARALYKKVVSDLRNPSQTFVLNASLSYHP